MGARQVDVHLATGIPIYRLSGYETGKLELSQAERRSLFKFLRERLAAISDTEAGDSDRLELLVSNLEL